MTFLQTTHNLLDCSLGRKESGRQSMATFSKTDSTFNLIGQLKSEPLQSMRIHRLIRAHPPYSLALNEVDQLV